jgi:hypothetical protein
MSVCKTLQLVICTSNTLQIETEIIIHKSNLLFYNHIFKTLQYKYLDFIAATPLLLCLLLRFMIRSIYY